MSVMSSVSAGNPYALKELRSHGMCDSALRDVYSAVVVAKLLYASPVWREYASTSDKQRIEVFIRRGVRLGFYGAGDPTSQQLADDDDERLFLGVRYSEHHITTSSQTSPATTTASDLDNITLYSQQKPVSYTHLTLPTNREV